MDDRLLSIGIVEAREKCKDITDVEQRVKAAMKVMKNHWFVTDEPQQFRAAIAAAVMESPEQEAEILIRSNRNLAKLSISIQATMSGMEVSDANLEDGEMLPIMGWWKEVK
jgi:hypothetical protein